jgi:Zn-dependent protease with chaperone function
MYYGLAFLLTLAGFLAANVLASLGAAALAGPLVRALGESATGRRVHLLLALRLFPSAASAAFALGLLLPAYVLFEPYQSGEEPGVALALVGAVALAVVVAGLRRGLASWRATSRLERAWRRTAEPVSLPHALLPISIYRIRDPLPVVGLVGTLRPRLYVARQVLDVLTPAELAAAVTHEAGHGLAFDNLKRLVLRAAPDVLAFLPAARWLEQEWAKSSELAADAHAASRGAAAALDLCAALVKVARLAPVEMPASVAVSPLHGGSDLGLRVRQLAAAAGTTVHPASAPTGAWIGVGLLAAALVAVAPELLHAVHRLTEAAVRWLI